MRSFASDNNAGVSPEILQALNAANVGHTVAYGDDSYTGKARKKFKEVFGAQVETHFVFNGTAANVLSIKSLTQPYNAVLCAETAHIYTDECGAPESLTGCKLLPIGTPDGKLTIDLLKTRMGGRGDQHHVQPKIVSITQSSELGTVYSKAEVLSLSKFIHDEGLLLHMDGARIANAAVSLGCTLKEITGDVGVDVLSFGGTKNGILGGEAVVFFNKDAASDFKYFRKQFMQLSSKMRFIAVQFETLLTNELWKKNATNSNKMAQLLAKHLETVPKIKICQAVQANGVFAKVPKELISKLQEKYFFYVWNETNSEVRWMTSFDTTEEDVLDFVKTIKSLL